MRQPVTPINFIAEISANHLGSKDRAHELIDAAADAGATSVKFQTYTPDTMTLDLPTFSVSNDHELWGGRTLYSLYQEAMTPWEWHPELFDHCRLRGVVPFSSPFDATAVEFLENLNAPMYKIASLETSDLALIRKVGETGKPVIISTGATLIHEIEELVETFYSTGNKNLTLLVCTSSYPADPGDANLLRILTLRNKFKCNIGLSDHTLGMGVALSAIALGASVIEKHLTLRRQDGGADGAFSMEPQEFKQLVTEGTKAQLALGNPTWKISDSEMESRRLRRSLYVVQDVRAGELVSLDNIRAIRPGNGLSPSLLEEVIGKTYKYNANRGTPLTLEMIK